MLAITTALLGLTLACEVIPPPTCQSPEHGYLAGVARNAISRDKAISDAAVMRLRAAGPAGLDALLTEHADALDRYADHLVSPSSNAADPQWSLLLRAIDTVAAQRDAFASRLYWHTDLDRAKALSRETGRPILSLHMLGRLDEDLSCANSRFLRTAVYANGAVSNALRDRFVLHWQSERPVPTITIDFGDGRTIERTITGNCCHLVLDEEGRVIDAIPGLYGPSAFLGAIDEAWRQHDLVVSDNVGDNRLPLEAAYHARRVKAIRASWSRDLGGVPGTAGSGALPAVLRRTAQRAAGAGNAAVPALVAAPIAVSKSGVEIPMLRLMAETDLSTFIAHTDESEWARIAESKAPLCRLDESSLLVMRKVTGLRDGARVEGNPLDRKARWLEERLALDTVRNEYHLHQQIHEWLGGDSSLAHDAARLTAQIYDALFLTPQSDPWLGLLGGEIYAALDNDGACTAAARTPISQ